MKTRWYHVINYMYLKGLGFKSQLVNFLLEVGTFAEQTK